MTITILGKRWRLVFCRMKDFGDCSDPAEPGRVIRIRKGLCEKTELETILHEALHAADWHRSEEFVDEVSTDIARVLWRLGWRKQSQ